MSTPKSTAEDFVNVMVVTSSRLDQWEVPLPRYESFADVLPLVFRAMRMSDSTEKMRIFWVEGERELLENETPASVGLRDGHSLSIEFETGSGGVLSGKVFISYSRRDRPFLDRLRIHLKPLERANVIDAWADDRIRAGDDWQERISESLGAACVAVLLISADFLASDFIVDNELPPILAAAQKNGTRVIPVVLNHCRFARDPALMSFQAMNDPRTPLVDLSEGERERVFDQVAQLIEGEVRKGLN